MGIEGGGGRRQGIGRKGEGVNSFHLGLRNAIGGFRQKFGSFWVDWVVVWWTEEV